MTLSFQDTLSKFDEVKKTMPGVVESQFVFKKHLFLDPEREITDEVEGNLLCFQVSSLPQSNVSVVTHLILAVILSGPP